MLGSKSTIVTQSLEEKTETACSEESNGSGEEAATLQQKPCKSKKGKTTNRDEMPVAREDD